MYLVETITETGKVYGILKPFYIVSRIIHIIIASLMSAFIPLVAQHKQQSGASS